MILIDAYCLVRIVMFLKAIVKDPKSVSIPFENYSPKEKTNFVPTPTLENVSIHPHKSLFDDPLNERIQKLEGKINELSSVVGVNDKLLPKLHNNLLKKAIDLNNYRVNGGPRKNAAPTKNIVSGVLKKMKPPKTKKSIDSIRPGTKHLKKKKKSERKSDRLYMRVLENIRNMYNED